MTKYVIRHAALAAVTLALLNGCGGGGGTNPSAGNQGSGQTSQFGQVILTSYGKLKPAVGNSGGYVTVSGAAGAPISAATLSPAQTNANSAIAIVHGGQLFISQNGNVNPISTIQAGQVLDATFGHNGKIYFAAQNSATGTGTQIFSVQYDGSILQPVSRSSKALIEHVQISSNNDWLSYYSPISDQYLTSAINGTEETVFSAGADYGTFSPDVSRIAYSTDPEGSNDSLYIANRTGGGTVGPLVNANSIGQMEFSPDGKALAVPVGTTDNNLKQQIYIIDAVSANPYFEIGGDGNTYDYPQFSPDGRQIGFIENAPSPSTQSDLVVDSLSDSHREVLASFPTRLTSMAWSPFYAPRLFIGNPGVLLTSAAGFLTSQVETAFSSFLAFSATTPATATITNQGAGAAIVYDLHADAITAVKYTNNYYGAVTSVALSANTPDVLVSFDAYSGQVASAAPYFRSNGSTPKAVVQGPHLVYQGKFAGVWNAKGKNIAPNGASQLTFDKTNGKLISAR